MKQTLAGAFLFASLLATGATGAGAADIDMGPAVEPMPSEWYLAISGGLNKVFDADYEADDDPFPFDDEDGEIEFNYGFRGAAAIGMRFGGNFRGELEFAGSSTDADEVNGNNVGGSLDIFSVLAKLDLEMTLFGWWHPYIGAGAGVAFVSLDGIGDSNDRIDDDETMFAAAIEGGSMFALSDNVELFTQTQLMFLGSDIDTHFKVDGDKISVDSPLVLSSSVGLRFKF
jgi:opacity protein-like surface antigen